MVLRDNYISAKEHAAEEQKQFEIEAEHGAMYETDLDAACAELGEVSVASLGAIEKKDGSYRVIHDATHGVSVNSAIKVRDQICCPGGGDLRRAMQTLPTAFFSLSGDWKHLCCRTGTKKDDVIWVNCVGTFGVSSAAYRALGDLRSSCSASLDGCSCLSSLELLATLAAVVLFDVPRGQQLGCACSASVDNRLLQSPRVEHLQPETSRPRTPKVLQQTVRTEWRAHSHAARLSVFFRHEGDTVGQVQQEHALRAKLQ